MIEIVSFHNSAIEELNETVNYYERIIQGLGISFLEEVERSTKVIQENPEAFPKILKAVRKKVLQRFPYSILYTFSTDEIRILAIANHKRRPHYWKERK